MNPKCILPVLFLSTLLAVPLKGQAFDSGSNGSYGPLDITTNTTLPMPPDGIFHCTTINIAAGRTLSFTKNPLNTPVYLLATGDVTIAGMVQVNAMSPTDGNGIRVGGTGGPGGFDGGASGRLGGVANRAAASGQGPGGGKRETSNTNTGSGSYAATGLPARATNGNIYGNALLLPLIGGSGGGGIDSNAYGGGGGGAILISSNTRITVSGAIQAVGGAGLDSFGNTMSNGGSGGAIRLVSPRVFGAGGLNAGAGNGGGNGRIRIDSLLRVDPLNTAQFLNLSYTGEVTLGSNMLVFPPPVRLDILEAAGTTIAEGAADPVYVALPYGTNPAQTVKVQSRGLGREVPIRVALIPESGDMITYDATIDNTTTNPATTTVNVVMPVNVKVQIQAWTR